MRKITHICLHTTGGSDLPENNRSYHTVITPIAIRRSVPYENIAPHAGTVTDVKANNGLGNALAGVDLPNLATNFNSYSVGIAFDGMTFTNREGISSLNEFQREAAFAEILELMKIYNIPVKNVVGHGEVVPLHRWFCPMPMNYKTAPLGEPNNRVQERHVHTGMLQTALDKSNIFSEFMDAFRGELSKRLNLAVLQQEQAKITQTVPTMPNRFNTLGEVKKHAPWAFDAVSRRVVNGVIRGNGHSLDLSLDMLRMFVFADRDYNVRNNTMKNVARVWTSM